jgi:hypothetical protein
VIASGDGGGVKYDIADLALPTGEHAIVRVVEKMPVVF